MPKYLWMVQCSIHKDIKKHFEQKTQAKNYYRWHLKDCIEVEEPLLVEAPFVG